MQESSKERVLSLLLQVRRDPDIPLPGGATEAELTEFEASTGLRLPSELRDWLQTCNGPCVGPGGLYGISQEREFLSMQKRLSLHPEWIDLGWIPLAGDGCGDEYVLDIKAGIAPNHPIYFLEHERTMLEPDYVVAVGVWRFLEMLLQDDLDCETLIDDEMLDNNELANEFERVSWWPFKKERVLAANPELADYQGNVPLAWEADRI